MNLPVKDFSKLTLENKLGLLFELIKNSPGKVASDYARVLVKQGFINVEKKELNQLLYFHKTLFNPNLNEKKVPAWTISVKKDTPINNESPSQFNSIETVLVNNIKLDQIERNILDEWIKNSYKGEVDFFYKLFPMNLINYLVLTALLKFKYVYIYIDKKSLNSTFIDDFLSFSKANKLNLKISEFNPKNKTVELYIQVLKTLSDVNRITIKEESCIIAFSSSDNDYDFNSFSSYIYIHKNSKDNVNKVISKDNILRYSFSDYLKNKNYMLNAIFLKYSEKEKLDYRSTCDILVDFNCMKNKNDWFDLWSEIDLEKSRRIKNNRNYQFLITHHNRIISNDEKYHYLEDFILSNEINDPILIYTESKEHIAFLTDVIKSKNLEYKLYSQKTELQFFITNNNQNEMVVLIDDSSLSEHIMLKNLSRAIISGTLGNSKKLYELIEIIDNGNNSNNFPIDLLVTIDTVEDYRLHPQAYSYFDNLFVKNEKVNIDQNINQLVTSSVVNLPTKKWSDKLIIFGFVSELTETQRTIIRSTLKKEITDIEYYQISTVNDESIKKIVEDSNAKYVYIQSNYSDEETIKLNLDLSELAHEVVFHLEKNHSFSIPSLLSFIDRESISNEDTI
jgi:hypothetical protein